VTNAHALRSSDNDFPDTCAVELLSKKELARREVSRRAISHYAYRAELSSREFD
jgi:hypothetical protein